MIWDALWRYENIYLGFWNLLYIYFLYISQVNRCWVQNIGNADTSRLWSWKRYLNRANGEGLSVNLLGFFRPCGRGFWVCPYTNVINKLKKDFRDCITKLLEEDIPSGLIRQKERCWRLLELNLFVIKLFLSGLSYEIANRIMRFVKMDKL